MNMDFYFLKRIKLIILVKIKEEENGKTVD